MSVERVFVLPDLGEGLLEGEILNWLVEPGQAVTLNQPIVEVETAKAAVEVPSPYDGVATVLHHKVGDVVDVGQPLITFAVSGEDAQDAAGGSPEAGGPTGVLVGYGPRDGRVGRRRRRGAPQPAQASPVPEPVPVPVPEPAAVVAPAILAKPPVRKLAKDLGVDLTEVRGTGRGGVITRDDVQAANAAKLAVAIGSPFAPAARLPRPDRFPIDPATGEYRLPVRGVRKATAAAMVKSVFTAPHVTEFVEVDVTETMDLLGRLKQSQSFAGVRLSPLVFAAKATLIALRNNPMLNSTWDEAAGEIIIKDYVNLGIAAATERGLIVPNIKDAGRLGLAGLAAELDQLAQVARAGRTSPAQMAGGTFTITNVGVFGVDTGTPVIYPGEAAILCLGAIRKRPWVLDDELAVRQVLPLAVSFDHRIVDGQQGSQFLADVARLLADPRELVDWTQV